MVSQVRDVWVLAEQRGEQLEDISLQVISGGRQLADELGEEVHVIVVGGGNDRLVETLASYGADEVYFLDSPLLLKYSAELYVEALSKLFEGENPKIVLCGATLVGRGLAPRLAARLKTGLVSECVGLALNEEGLLLGTKLTHGGKIASTILCLTSWPQMATVKSGVIEKRKLATSRKPDVKIISSQFTQKEPRSKAKGFIKADPKKISLDEAEIIVAGGRGAGNVENFQLVRELAKSLGGVIAGSLGAVDEGWVPRKKLVGQTGATVAPKLYIACGISGSIYHVLGMRDSEVIIAINKDRNAPIFRYADVGIVGDAAEVIPAIINQLDELSEGPTEVGNVREI